MSNADLQKRIEDLEKRLATWDGEVAAAAEIQTALLPKTLPKLPGISLAAECRQASGVGGDFYDCWQLSRSNIALLIGDVSGHGLPAALMAAQLKTLLRRELVGDCLDLAAKISSLNDIMCDMSASRRYVTLFYGELDVDRLTLRYVNAGHPPPFVVSPYRPGEKLTSLTEGGVPLGMFPTPPVPYGFGECYLMRGDTLVAFSDGITEAENSALEAYGLEGIKRSVSEACRTDGARAILLRILRDVSAFSNGSMMDDMTVLALSVQED